MFASFIIPVYNGHKTIKRCLDSIYALPLEEDSFEVILVDDASTDDTVELVKSNFGVHNNMIVLCQPSNHRQGAARNRGVKLAKGDYVVFVDSDDEVDHGILTALHLAESRHLDMTVMRCAFLSETGIVLGEKTLPYDQNHLFNGVQLQTEYPFWGTAPWAYIYSKSFLDRVDYPFEEDVLYEDSDFVNVHLYYSTRMGYSDDCGYKLYSNPESTTHTVSARHLCDYALLGSRMLRFYEQLEDKSTVFAASILEGGSYNIMIAFRKLYKLDSAREIRDYYKRLDSHCDRKAFRKYKEPSYCWKLWTRIGVWLPSLMVVLAGSWQLLRKVLNK